MSWLQLLDIREQARAEFEAFAERPPMACPNDGEPLRQSPSADSGSGCELYCPYDGFQYPRDWVRPEML